MIFPSQWFIYIALGACAAAFGSGWSWRGSIEEARDGREKAAQLIQLQTAVQEALALGIAQGEITITAGTRVAEAKEKIVYRTITQIREVPIYVTPEDDRACVIPPGVVQLLNAAASPIGSTSLIPDPATGAYFAAAFAHGVDQGDAKPL